MDQATCHEATGLTDVMREWGRALPYSTLDVFLSRPVAAPPSTASPSTSLDAAGPRPGVCFTLNTAFAAHLRRAGWSASLHLAGVQDHDSPDRADVGSHVTVVTELDGLPHLTDVGLGCGPLRPLPLRGGLHDFHGFDFPLTRVERDGQDWWRLDIPEALSRAFRAMEFCATPDPQAALARADHFLSPTTGPLRDVLLLQGWVGDSLVTVHGPTVSVRSAHGTRERHTHEDVEHWLEAVDCWFPGRFDHADLRAAWARLEEEQV